MSNILKADIVVTIHLGILAFVVVGQLLFLVCWPFGWHWVRNFWLRLAHLLAIGYIATEAVFGIKCPLTIWEAMWRPGPFQVGEAIYPAEMNKEGASWIARLAIDVLYYPGGDDAAFRIRLGTIVFGLLVLTTFVVVPPRWPWRKKPAPRPADALAG
jgi:Protein of Unknown function (DUF2784)